MQTLEDVEVRVTVLESQIRTLHYLLAQIDVRNKRASLPPKPLVSIDDWISVRTDRSSANERTPRTDLYEDFRKWCEQQNKERCGPRDFFCFLEAAGFTQLRLSSGRYFVGIRLKPKQAESAKDTWAHRF